MKQFGARKKRFGALAATLLAASMVFAACGGGGGGGQGTGSAGEENGAGGGTQGGGTEEIVNLTFETSVYAEAPHKRAIDALIERYQELNPHVRITVMGADYANFWDKLTTEVIAGTQGDIVQVYPENIPTYHSLVEGGAFLNLDPYIKGTDLETNLVGQELTMIDGSYYAISNYAWGTTGIFYRKSLFEESGIDPESIKTLEDFKEAAIKLGQKENQYGFASVVGSHPFVASEWYRLVARVVSGGMYFPDGESGPYTADRINVNSKENVWAAEWWQDFIRNEHATPPGTRDKTVAREMFWNGQAAMVMDGPWFIGMTRERDEKLMDDLGLMPQPVVEYEGKTYKPNPTNYPLVAMISKKTKHPEEAWKFLEWMASEEAQELVNLSGMIPSNKNYIATDEYRQENPLAAKFFEFQEELYAPQVMDPPIPQLGTLTQIMVNTAQDMFIAGKDAKTALDEAAEEMKEVMRQE